MNSCLKINDNATLYNARNMLINVVGKINTTNVYETDILKFLTIMVY